MINVFTAFQSRFLQKPKAVFDMNYLLPGRKIWERDITPLKVAYKYRTGFFGGEVIYVEGLEIPKNIIIRTSTNSNQEGLEIIPPFIPGTPGYTIFREYPFFMMAQILSQLDEAKMKLAVLASTAKTTNDFTELKNLVFEVVDTFTSVRQKLEVLQPQTPIGFGAQQTSEVR